jgi:hypothetical protein
LCHSIERRSSESGDDPALQVHPTGQTEVSFWVGTDEAFRGEIQRRLEWHRGWQWGSWQRPAANISEREDSSASKVNFGHASLKGQTTRADTIVR